MKYKESTVFMAGYGPEFRCVGQCTATRDNFITGMYQGETEGALEAPYIGDCPDNMPRCRDTSKASESWSARGTPVPNWPQAAPVRVDTTGPAVVHVRVGRR